MARTPQPTKGTAKCASCASCAFGRAVTIIDYDKHGKQTGTRDMCECHVARTTRNGFHVVRLDDFCSCHVDAATFERTFAGLVAIANGGAQ